MQYKDDEVTFTKVNKHIQDYTHREIRCLAELILGKNTIPSPTIRELVVDAEHEHVNFIRTKETDLLLITPKETGEKYDKHSRGYSDIAMRARYYNAKITSEYFPKDIKNYSKLRPLITIFFIPLGFTDNMNSECIVSTSTNRNRYFDDGETIIAVAVRGNKEKTYSSIYKNIAGLVNSETEQYSDLFALVIDCLTGRNVNIEYVAKIEEGEFFNKILLLNKGVMKVNFVKQALIEGEQRGREEGIAVGELRGKIKMCKFGFGLSLKETQEKLKNTDADLVKHVYNALIKED